MSIDDWLKLSELGLQKAGIVTARLDVLVLLEDATSKNRTWLLAHPEFMLSQPQVKKLNKQIVRRAGHEPLAYIRNKTEFYGREFYIDHRVLEPRPESEAMLDLLKSFVQGSTLNSQSVKTTKNPLFKVEPYTVVDVGTGSGALAITAKLEIPEANVLATDIDKACLAVAKKNAGKLAASVGFYEVDLLGPVPGYRAQSTAVLANLPYVPDDFQINPAAMREPSIAIFGGPDGLDIYRRMFKQINQLKSKPKLILTESLPPQHTELAKIASISGYHSAKEEDFIQAFTA